MDCLSELNQSTVTLANLYDSIRKLDKEDVLEENDNGSEEEKSEQTEESSKIVSSSTPEIQDTNSTLEFQPPPKRIQKYTSDGKPVFA
jgi:hypothetical protein